jgi:hypothetical protein
MGLCSAPTCRKHLAGVDGIFCTNFSSRRGVFAPCEAVWCPGCFEPRGFKPFLVKQQVDEDGEEWIESGGATRFLVARQSDYLMAPFQCDLCHFRNVLGRNPDLCKPEDREILEYIRRATLDAFWARETSTVRNNAANARRILRTIGRLGLPPLLPPMGRFPLRDDMGMGGAIVVLDRSLDSGKRDTLFSLRPHAR